MHILEIMPPRPPPLPSSQHLLLQQPHIVDLIVDFLPKRSHKRTLVALLRSCYPLQDAAAKRLYHSDFLRFFAGSDVGTGKTRSFCGWLDDKRSRDRCQWNEARDKQPKVTIIRSSALDPLPQKSYAFLFNEDAVSAPPTHDAVDEPDAPSEGCDRGDHNTPTPAPGNTKAGLLAYVKVITMSSHHRCMCEHFGPVVSPLLSGLEVIRIANSFSVSLFNLDDPCDSDQSCPLFTGLVAPKLVFRNLDGQGLPLPQFDERKEQWPTELREPFKNCRWTASRHIKTVVLFLPTNGRCYHATNLAHIGRFFPAATEIKVVLYEHWEDYEEEEEIGFMFHGPIPVTPDDIVHPIQQILKHTSAAVTVYGLDRVDYAKRGEIVTQYLHRAPDPWALRPVHLIVINEVRTGMVFNALTTGKMEDMGWGSRLTLKTISKYKKDKDTAEHHAELTPAL
ncbi:uncharacterized protein LOC62_01G001552 [Vanrija pseudolonga]|uniref:Uncharacterized protein n=1 Tax=Vanrija pseudolonga TaxID=143232 RepID=A0AAF1BHT5_9TREE|nr:hypothetical protein LOC62_01G001552 [Vanrija pseudolonga]